MPFLQIVFATCLGWLFWRVVRVVMTQTTLSTLGGPLSKSWIWGSLDVLTSDAWAVHSQLAEKYGGIFRIDGFFKDPILYVYDPKALYHILIKDSPSYDEPRWLLSSNELVFGAGLLATKGDHHRRQRKLLNPAFSMGHMRQMVPTFYQVMFQLRDTLEGKIRAGDERLDILHWMSRAALELIGRSGLGYSFDPLTGEGSEHPFSIAVKQLASTLVKLTFSRMVLVPIVSKWGPPRLRRLVIDALSLVWRNLRRARDMVDVMHNTAVEIYDEKEKLLAVGDEALAQQAGDGHDLISILMKENMKAKQEDQIPKDEVVAQILTLTFAAMDTTSNALARILSVLSEHPEAQHRLRQEIREATGTHGPQLDYDVLMGLPHLDGVIRESLRLYAPVPLLQRVANQDMILPVSKPVTGPDGRQLSEVPVPSGTDIIISALGANTNTGLWGQDALDWKPERWLSPLPDKLLQAKTPGVYGNLMTFMGGGRACIGFKFSELEMKVALAVLIERFHFTPLDTKILWRINGIAQPFVEEAGYEAAPQLPIRVEIVNDSST